MGTCTSLLCAVLCAPGILVVQPQTGSAPVAELANIRFHSDPLLNLHHTLYAAAWARRPDAARSLAGRLPAPLDASLTDAERNAWDAAVDYYDKHVASRDLLRGNGMEALKGALVAGDLASPAIGPDLRKALEAAAPVYQRHFWPEHDRANRQWIAATVDRMKTVAPDVIARLEKLYGAKWFSSPVRADIVWVGSREGAFTTIGPPPHATISIADGDWAAVEIVFHEFSHILVLPLQRQIAKAFGERIREHRVLWHVVQFYLTGAAVQEVLASKGISFTPYMYATGLFDRAWGQYRKAVEANWAPYVRGTVGLEDAIAGTLTMLAGVK